MNKDISLVVLSCDAFEDTWLPFFQLKDKYWAECPYETYLFTETKDCPFVKTVKTTGEWSKRVREGLAQIPTKYVLITLDDFFLRDYVKQERIDAIEFGEQDAVYNFELAYNLPVFGTEKTGFKKRVNGTEYMLSCQPSLWDKEKLIELLKQNMNPWQWETQKINSPYNHWVNTSGELIMDIGYYDHKPWSIKQGKWCREIVPFFEKEGVEMDFTKRGFNDMTLSIIIPMYNTVPQCKELLDILKPQLTDECELLIIDDGSTQDTSPLGKVYRKERGHVQCASPARNYGLDIASGEFVVFIDSDDRVAPDYIKSILDKIHSSKFDYCYFGWEGIGRLQGRFMIRTEPETWNTSVWNCVYRRSMIGDNRFDENRIIAEDEDFNKRVRKGVRANIDKILYTYVSTREDSITGEYMKGKLPANVNEAPKKDPNAPIDTQILVYQKAVSVIGGIETFLYEFFKAMKDKYDILFVYEYADPVQLRRYQQLVPCMKNLGQTFTCDKYLCASNQNNIADQVEARENWYATMIHADYKAMNWAYRPHHKTTHHIAVSKTAQNGFHLDSMLIYNLLEPAEPKRVLKLISATRLSWEKGQERINIIAQRLSERGIPFVWQVFTNDLPNKTIDGLIYRKPTLDIEPYIADADYLLQLSNTESFGYSTYQAFNLGTPVVATDYPAIHEQGMQTGVNGYVLTMNLSNLDEVIDNMYNNQLKGFKYEKLHDPQDWINVLGVKEKKTNYVYEEKDVMVQCTYRYGFNDVEHSGKFRKFNEVWECSQDRAEYLIGRKLVKYY